MTGQLITTQGRKDAAEIGMILPHEHIFVDLRTGNPPGFAQAKAEDVIKLMAPELVRARESGVGALVECTPLGVGRRADLVKAVSDAAAFPVVLPTGIYREPWIPDWARQADEGALCDWMLRELTGAIEGSGVQAGWIKLSAGDNGLTPCETRILRAAAKAATATGAAIGSHTVQGRVVHDQLRLIEEAGYTPERFIWIHSQAEPRFELQLEIARRGAWIEYDWIGNAQAFEDEYYLDLIRRMLDAGLVDHLLLSMDRGWYDPAQLHGGTPQPFTYLTTRFLPKLRGAGVDEATIHRLTCENPFRAFAR